MGDFLRIQNKKLIFIHIPKTGGTSLNDSISPFVTIDAIRFRDGKSIPKGHMTLLQTKQSLKEHNINDEYTYFTLIRNPWERLVSHYFYILQNNDIHWLPIKKMSFYEFIDFSINLTETYSGIPRTIFDSQTNYIGDGNEILIDYVIKLENFNLDIKFMLDDLSINSDIVIPHKNKSKHKNYIEYYNNEYINKVYEWEKLLINKYNYVF